MHGSHASRGVGSDQDHARKEKGCDKEKTLSDMGAMTLVEPLANTLTYGGRE